MIQYDHEYALYIPYIECCDYDIATTQEHKSYRMDGFLLAAYPDDALAFFTSGNLNAIGWGVHKTAELVDEGPPAEFIWVDAGTTIGAYAFEHNVSGFPYGQAKSQSRFAFTLAKPWRAEDGVGIHFKQGSIGENYTFHDPGGYVLDDFTTSEATGVVNIAPGATSGYLPVQTWTALGTEGFWFKPYAAEAPVPFSVSTNTGGVYEQGQFKPPPASGVAGQHSLRDFYSERRGFATRDIVLTFGSELAGLYPMTIDFTLSTYDLEGNFVSSAAGSPVSLSSPFDHPTRDVPAPATDGRTFAHDFVTATVEFFHNPLFRGTVVCVDPIP